MSSMRRNGNNGRGRRGFVRRVSVFIGKTFRSRIEAQAIVLKTGVQEKNDHGNQRN